MKVLANNLFELGRKKKKENKDEALKLFNKALEHNPEHYGVLLELGNVHRSIEYYKQANNIFKDTMGFELGFINDRISRIDGTWKERKYYVPRIKKPKQFVQLSMF